MRRLISAIVIMLALNTDSARAGLLDAAIAAGRARQHQEELALQQQHIAAQRQLLESQMRLMQQGQAIEPSPLRRKEAPACTTQTITTQHGTTVCVACVLHGQVSINCP